MSFDIDLVTTPSVVNKTIRWTIRGLSDLPDVIESSQFPPIENGSSKWTICLIYRSYNFIQIYLKSLDSKNTSTFVPYKVKGNIALKNSDEDIYMEQNFDIRLDPSSSTLCFDFPCYPGASGDKSKLDIFELKDDILVIECALTISVPVTRTISNRVMDDSEEFVGRNPFP